MLLRVVPNWLPTENQKNYENADLYLLDLIIIIAVSYIF